MVGGGGKREKGTEGTQKGKIREMEVLKGQEVREG